MKIGDQKLIKVKIKFVLIFNKIVQFFLNNGKLPKLGNKYFAKKKFDKYKYVAMV